ncbi:MAG TPA: hypothetical protein VFV52_11605 [Bacilli bacterium]|nr:hypothetical protein [Bacilli bacterium]
MTLELLANVQEFLNKYQVPLEAQTVIDMIERRVPHFELAGPSGQVHLVQLYHPVVKRREVFLGNVLFNAYLGLTMQQALSELVETDVLSVAHDLETYYLLVHTTRSYQELQAGIRQGWIDGLENLYFSEPDEDEMDEAAQQGYYGSFSTMLQNYYKSNIQPFPLMIVPLAYAEKLEQRIRAYLLDRLSTGAWTREIANFTANFSFFYGQTSGGSGDVQSCPNFLRRLVDEYQVVSPKDMTSAFQLPQGTDFSNGEAKSLIQEKIFKKGDTPAYYKEKLQEVFEQTLHHFGESIEKHAEEGGEPSEWLFRYHREKGVFLDLSPEELLDQLIVGATVGGRTITRAGSSCTDESCTMCGYHGAQLAGATIISTDSFSKFHNHTINRGSKEKRICYNCALYAYLTIKLSGSKSGGMGQIPRTGNLVFHYGAYTDGEIRKIADRFAEQLECIKRSTDEVKEMPDPELARIFGVEDGRSQYRVLRSLLLRNDNGEVRLFPIRFGKMRLILFVLPGLHEDVQKRLDFSRYSTMNVLSWLHRVSQECEADKGSFYFQALPKVEQVLQGDPKLYIKDRQFDVDKQIELHEYYRKVVPELSMSRTKGGFEYQIIVAERIQRDPLGVLGHELRGWMQEGRVRRERQDRFYDLYTKLRDIDRQEIELLEEEEKEARSVINSVEVKTADGDVRTISVDLARAILDEFTDNLFHTLDVLDLLPKSLSDRPHAFEKWARDLIAPLKRNGTMLEDVLDKWENRVLRQHSFYPKSGERVTGIKELTRQKRLDAMRAFRTFCEASDHQAVIKANVTHLMTSLLAKAVAYLYPVLELARAYTNQHLEQPEFFEPGTIAMRFEEDVQQRFQELSEKRHVTEAHLKWAQEHLVVFSGYYVRFKKKEEVAGGEAV